MKVAIVVPYSWSFWGGVVDHAEQQLLALRELGVDAWLVMGNDPPGSFTHVLHPGLGRHGTPPEYVLPVGRSVIVPANGSLPNIVLSPTTPLRIKRIFERGALRPDPRPRADDAGDRRRRGRVVARPDGGDVPRERRSRVGWTRGVTRGGTSSPLASTGASPSRTRRGRRRTGGCRASTTIVPNGVIVPPEADPANREDHVVFIGRHEPRKGMHIMLRAWPEIRRRTGARLRLVGADPLAVRLVLTRERVPDDGIDVLGALSNDDLTDELLRAKVQVASSLGGESFGMVLTRGLACALPVVASDIPGYRAVLEGEAGVLVPPGDAGALAAAVVDVLGDEETRQRRGAAARVLASERYAWDGIARRLLDIYEEAAA